MRQEDFPAAVLMDREAKTKGIKAAMHTGTVAKYREGAQRHLLADPNVREAVFQQSMKARAAVAARSGAGVGRQTGADALGAVGRAFGVDLGG